MNLVFSSLRRILLFEYQKLINNVLSQQKYLNVGLGSQSKNLNP